MAKWRVYNRHSQGLTHRERYKEQFIEIKAGDYALMDYEDAVQFKGQYFPMKKNPQGAPDPTSWKMLELVRHDPEVKQEQEYICHFDGRKFPTQKDLDQHLTENYSDKTFKDEALDEEIKTKRKGKSA